MANKDEPESPSVYQIDLEPGKARSIIENGRGNFYVAGNHGHLWLGSKDLKPDGDNGAMFSAESFQLTLFQVGTVYAVSTYATRLRILHLP